MVGPILVPQSKDIADRGLMWHFEIWVGEGSVLSNTGQREPVRHVVHTYQMESQVGTREDPHEAIPGALVIQGGIHPVCFMGQAGLILEMQDGRRFRFDYTDMHGSITFR